MIQKIRNSLKKRKVKVFLLCLFISSGLWFLVNLSKTFEAKATINLNFTNSNKSLLLTKAFKDQAEVKLRAVGFQFLNINFSSRSVSVNLKNVKNKNGKYYLLPKDLKSQIEKQLPNANALISVESDTLFFSFLEMVTKKVPVVSHLNINLAANHIIQGEVQKTPAEIEITGPLQEIDTITSVTTEDFELENVAKGVYKTLKLKKPSNLKYTTFEQNEVTVKAKVLKFSEKVFNVPITVINLPENKELKAFPAVVSILCKAAVTDLLQLNSTDFTVVADYNKQDNSENLYLEVTKKPKNIFSAAIMANDVAYIISSK